jgi:hypothetical protein
MSVPEPMPNFLRPASVVAFAVFLAACSGSNPSVAPSVPQADLPSGSPSGSPALSPAAGGLEHPTGATDVVLRSEVGGGFVMAGFAASQVPTFTLYGDGTIVFRNDAQELPPMQGSVMRTNPLRTAKLSEDQIQDLLVYALEVAGLGVARAQYDNPMVADAGTTTFTIDAGGVKKAVAITALGMEDVPGVPDMAARRGFGELATRLADFDQGGAIATDVYRPTAYRGILMDGTGNTDPNVVPWPWDDIKPADFKGPADPNAFQLATRTLTPEEVAALGIDGPEGGFQNLLLGGPGDGKLYSFALRPLLPDDAE